MTNIFIVIAVLSRHVGGSCRPAAFSTI